MKHLDLLEAMGKVQKTRPGDHDYKRGIMAYTENVNPCGQCKRQCNTYWKPSQGNIKPVFTCCQECADRVASRFLK